jgi:hypothetical protein
VNARIVIENRRGERVVIENLQWEARRPVLVSLAIAFGRSPQSQSTANKAARIMP